MLSMWPICDAVQTRQACQFPHWIGFEISAHWIHSNKQLYDITITILGSTHLLLMISLHLCFSCVLNRNDIKAVAAVKGQFMACFPLFQIVKCVLVVSYILWTNLSAILCMTFFYGVPLPFFPYWSSFRQRTSLHRVWWEFIAPTSDVANPLNGC